MRPVRLVVGNEPAISTDIHPARVPRFTNSLTLASASGTEDHAQFDRTHSRAVEVPHRLDDDRAFPPYHPRRAA